MYKRRDGQIGIEDFGQAIGVKLSPDNRWVKKAESIPWEEIEERYAALFESTCGNVAKPSQMALGALLIQDERKISDEETVMQIMETPALQYFCGMPRYEEKMPFDPSLMVHFRKRLTKEILCEINELIIQKAEGDHKDDDDNQNSGTLIVDATCAPQYIKYPQDIELLNEAREKTEEIIDKLHGQIGGEKPRTYRKKARKEYLKTIRKRRKTVKEIRLGIGRQLGYLGRNLGHIERYRQQGLTADTQLLETIAKLYEQQLLMHQNRIHSVPNRIVSLSQPYVRPIVRGKAKAPVEFGAKLDISVTGGFARLEYVSYEAYNEAENLQQIIERYYRRKGRYPARVLADKIYRNRSNLAYCKDRGIRLSGPALGRPKKDAVRDKQQEYADICDRVEVERSYSTAKRSHGLGLIRTRLYDTSLSVISLAILAMNIAKIFCAHFWAVLFRLLVPVDRLKLVLVQ